MPTMYDYLEWRGDITFAERPLNDVDALVLASVCYIDFAGALGEDGEATLAEAAHSVLEQVGDDLSPRVKSMATLDARFLRLVGESVRFGGARVRNVVDVIDPARSLQFAAMEFVLDSGVTYVAFRGTDLSLVGWQEDFMLSFTVTDAQRLASSYLERALRLALDEGRSVVVGGHSKGGNLVSYAVATCPAELLGTVRAAYSFDGPGTAPELLKNGAYALLGERYHRIQPGYSIIGALFEREGEPRAYVASDAKGMLQHDPTSWQVGRDFFVTVAELAPDAAVFNQAITEWLQATPFEERAGLTEELFSILGAGGATTLPEVFQSPGVQQVMSAAGSASEESKAMATRLVETVLNMTLANARVATKTALDEAVVSAAEAMQSAYDSAAQGAAEIAKSIVARRQERRRDAGEQTSDSDDAPDDPELPSDPGLPRLIEGGPEDFGGPESSR